MRRVASALGLALGLALLLGAPADASAAKVDAALVGSWRLDEPATPFNQGSRQILEILADGTYTLFSPAKGHAGAFEGAGGQWSLASRTSTWKDGGRYEVKGRTTLALTGVFGPSTWQRFSEPPNFATTPIGGQPIPAYVPQAVARTWVDAAIPWQPDAIPVDLEITLWERTGEFQMRIRYLSPGKRAGLVVDSFRYERRVTEQANVSWPSKAMPLGFVDLPRAVALFTQEGRPGSVQTLHLHRRSSRLGLGRGQRKTRPKRHRVDHRGRAREPRAQLGADRRIQPRLGRGARAAQEAVRQRLERRRVGGRLLARHVPAPVGRLRRRHLAERQLLLKTRWTSVATLPRRLGTRTCT
ncbi:MAG: hypothetical protein IPK07_12645 [Deltaproteobacteria bacterium]|nr:hypothetical protein [Deltaproteobacteria bacterium]